MGGSPTGLTCQSAVDAVVPGPEPEHGLRLRLHLVHALPGHHLEVAGTLVAAEEVFDVGPHRLQYLLRPWARGGGAPNTPSADREQQSFTQTHYLYSYPKGGGKDHTLT